MKSTKWREIRTNDTECEQTTQTQDGDGNCLAATPVGGSIPE
jgi:hypothetical protein